MKFRILCAALPILFVAACGKGDAGGNSSSAPAAAPVAGAKAPAGQNWVDVVSKTPEGGYVMGNPNAPVKLIEYGSRSCPHCAVFDAEGFPALKAGPIAAGKLSYEFRDFPVHGAVDIGPILVGHCVEPAQFFPMLDQMMASQQQLVGRTDKKISDEDQARLQKSSPGQVATFLSDFYGYVDFAKQADSATRQYNVSGTPTFIVNGTVAANVADWAGLQPVLKAAGAL